MRQLVGFGATIEGINRGAKVTLKAVFLDLYQTVAFFHPPREQRMATTLAELGIRVDARSLVRAFVAADHHYALANAKTPVHRLSPEESRRIYIRYHEVLLQEAGLGHVAHMAEQIYNRYWELEREFRLFPDVLPALERIRALGYRLGMITNVNSDPSGDLERVGLKGQFDVIVASSVVGFEKPDARIFGIALDALGVAPHEAVHVGDGLLADVEGAKAAGLKAVLLDRHDLLVGLHHPRIRSLLELPAILQNGLRE